MFIAFCSIQLQSLQLQLEGEVQEKELLQAKIFKLKNELAEHEKLKKLLKKLQLTKDKLEKEYDQFKVSYSAIVNAAWWEMLVSLFGFQGMMEWWVQFSVLFLFSRLLSTVLFLIFLFIYFVVVAFMIHRILMSSFFFFTLCFLLSKSLNGSLLFCWTPFDDLRINEFKLHRMIQLIHVCKLLCGGPHPIT